MGLLGMTMGSLRMTMDETQEQRDPMNPIHLRSLFVILPFFSFSFVIIFFVISLFVILIPLCHSERSEESKPADVQPRGPR